MYFPIVLPQEHLEAFRKEFAERFPSGEITEPTKSEKAKGTVIEAHSIEYSEKDQFIAFFVEFSAARGLATTVDGKKAETV